MGDILNGMKEISNYVGGLSSTTVLEMHRGQDMPMRKNGGKGVWISSKAAIDEWNQLLLNKKSPLVGVKTKLATDKEADADEESKRSEGDEVEDKTKRARKRNNK